VVLTQETEYPFRESIRIRVLSQTAVRFPLHLRIPGWAEGASLRVNGGAQLGVRAGTFHRIERLWKPGDVVSLRLPMRLRVTRWFRNSIAIERGPLVFALKIGEDWRKIRQHGPAADWEVHPTTPWNYALLVDERRPERTIRVIQRTMGKTPYSADGAPIELRVSARKLPEWKLENGSAGLLPESPVTSDQPLETVTLIPYGSAKLRITAFPQLAR
jgi:hypothetical protein